MYSTFSHTFSSATHGDKKFYLTLSKTGKEDTFEGKINDDKSVKKFLLKKDDTGNWKIQSQELPAWVMELESEFSSAIEEIAAR